MENDHAENRRKNERYTFREHVLIDDTIPCTISDISENGLYVSAVQQFEQDRIVSITIPFKDNKVTVRARVQYCQPGIGMGVMFVDLDNKQKEFLREIIEHVNEASLNTQKQ